MYEMQGRYDDDDAYTAIGQLGEEEEERESIDRTYTEAELNEIDAAEAERIRQQKQLEALQKSMAESRKHINRSSTDYYDDEDYLNGIRDIQSRSNDRQRMLQQALGLTASADEERIQQQRKDSLERVQAEERERNRPLLVLKSQEANAEKFNTVLSDAGSPDTPLIRAMIDQTTKAHEGTRIRFKLLDNVTIHDIKIPKGTYLYGSVTGFGQQRVRAKVESILIGNRFVKVDLSVFDNDGMEGFYVPESAFRDFIKEAGSQMSQMQMQFNSGSSYGGINAEVLALQALQNLYGSASQAITTNIRKNRAKIKYNTIVYLINSQDAQ
jgi:conjugative transposon TraM protein